MLLTALVKSLDHVSCRYRLAALRPQLACAGHRLELRAWPRFWPAAFLLSRDLRRSDVVILQRQRLPAWQLHWLRRRARCLLYDFDDAVFIRDSYEAGGQYSERRMRGFSRMVRAADAVLAGNAFLRDQAAWWTDPRRLHIVPTCLDPSPYPLAEHRPRAPGAQLVWIGSSSTIRGLERIEGMLEDIGRRFPGISLKLICDRSLPLTQLPVRWAPWSEKSEGSELASADIGISWLPEDAWSLGKCGLKVLQYMAAGLPVVANPIGVQAELVEHGVNGFLATTPRDWFGAIERLAQDAELRRRMGRAGRLRVEQRFHVAHAADCWLAILEQIAVGRRAA